MSVLAFQNECTSPAFKWSQHHWFPLDLKHFASPPDFSSVLGRNSHWPPSVLFSGWNSVAMASSDDLHCRSIRHGSRYILMNGSTWYHHILNFQAASLVCQYSYEMHHITSKVMFHQS